MLFCFLCFAIWVGWKGAASFPRLSPSVHTPGAQARGCNRNWHGRLEKRLQFLGVPAHVWWPLWLSSPLRSSTLLPNMETVAFRGQPPKDERWIKMLQYTYFFPIQPVTLSAKCFSRKFYSLNTMVNIKTSEGNERKTKGRLLCFQKENILVLQDKICKKNKLYFKKRRMKISKQYHQKSIIVFLQHL